ncbi:hypothetical protein [Pseudogulbenkiania subflava]|uniref:Lipoprotein n=1 Tax=Pseudogulbenkiania subflava DSM 22618 TaxID=1123014 RepID=A0A1Y6C4U9_9NEIS|nr:hypothetical protein [Pseudogulbenkiania subflava]SMF45790.1 hypothetical protein SAMN02745746_03389 [Pseudogulbenkiania subflava DSM 22618]
MKTPPSFLVILTLISLVACGDSPPEASSPLQERKAAELARQKTEQDKKREQKQAAYLQIVRDSLKDPDSAQFRDLQWSIDHEQYGDSLCGWVNAKNSLGWYVGFHPFAVTAKPLKGSQEGRLILPTEADDSQTQRINMVMLELAGCGLSLKV